MKDVTKTNLKFLLKLLVFGVLLVLSLWIMGRIFIPKWKHANVTKNLQGFYNESKNSIDVLFIGSSDAANGFSPIELWDKTGTASYVYSSQGQRIWTSYYMLKETFKYQSPKVVVLNVDGCFDKSRAKEGNRQKIINNMHWGKAKWEMLNDPVYKNSTNDIISYILPVFRYHDRYDDLNAEDFVRGFIRYHAEGKGYNINLRSKPWKKGTSYMKATDEVTKLPESNREYFEKIISLCEENDAQLVLAELPSTDAWNMKKSNSITAFAKEKGLTFIDFNLMLDEIELDWKNDTIDGGDHLNLYGAKKVTDYMAQYLSENYDLPNHKNDEKYSSWKKDCKKYNDNINKRLEKNENKNYKGKEMTLTVSED